MLRFTIYTLRFLSILFLLYSILIAVSSGIKSSFLWFYVVFACSAAILSFLLPAAFQSSFQPLAVCGKALIAVFWLLFLLFLIVQIRIISDSRGTPPQNADYVIILGAQVRGKTPSAALMNRIDAAYQYLAANEDTLVICSGGRGSGEEITEASAIRTALMQKGIQSGRILLEEESTNTSENLEYSSRFIQKDTDIVIVVSNDFHLYRAVRIAKKTGIQHIYGLSKKEFFLTTPGYYIREFFAVIKDQLFGNM